MGLDEGAKAQCPAWGGVAGQAQSHTHRFCSLEEKRNSIIWCQLARDMIKISYQALKLPVPQLTSPLLASSAGGLASRQACWPAGPPPLPPETQAQSFRTSVGEEVGSQRGCSPTLGDLHQ